MAGEELCLEDEERWSGVAVIAKEVEGGAEAIGSRSWGGSTDAGVAGVEVTGSGAMGGGGEDVYGVGGVAVSSAREPKTVDMTAVASMVAAGGAAEVATAGVATSDTGVGVGGSGVEKTTIAVSVVAGGGVDVGGVAVAEEVAASSTNICASTID